MESLRPAPFRRLPRPVQTAFTEIFTSLFVTKFSTRATISILPVMIQSTVATILEEPSAVPSLSQGFTSARTARHTSSFRKNFVLRSRHTFTTRRSLLTPSGLESSMTFVQQVDRLPPAGASRSSGQLIQTAQSITLLGLPDRLWDILVTSFR